MKDPKRRGAAAPKHESARANLRLETECYRRLLVASVMEGRSAGEIVSRLIADHLRRWSLPADLSARVRDKDRAVESGGISPDVAEMAA